MENERRVVVTGIGAVTSLGIGARETFENLVEGKSGIDFISLYDASNQQTRFAAEVKNFDPIQYFPRKKVRRLGRYTQFALLAAQEAIDQAGLNFENENPDRVATIVASTIGDFPMIEDHVKDFYALGPGKMSPFLVPKSSPNMAAAGISLEYGLLGPGFGLSSACATGSHAIAISSLLIESGIADIVIAGGTEAAISPSFLESYIALKALSSRNDAPQKASRPFDRDRDGFVMGEGAGILVLETLKHATERGAEILAEVAGYGMTSDAYHITAAHPEGRGAAQAIKIALEKAKMNPEEIDYVNAHGTSTPINDPAETRALKTAFGDYAYDLPISSNKSMIGHCIGAAGSIEAVNSIMTMKNNIIPPTINLENPDPLCDLDYVPNVAREKKVSAVISNSFGFGGQNCVLVFREFNG